MKKSSSSWKSFKIEKKEEKESGAKAKSVFQNFMHLKRL